MQGEGNGRGSLARTCWIEEGTTFKRPGAGGGKRNTWLTMHAAFETLRCMNGSSLGSGRSNASGRRAGNPGHSDWPPRALYIVHSTQYTVQLWIEGLRRCGRLKEAQPWKEVTIHQAKVDGHHENSPSTARWIR